MNDLINFKKVVSSLTEQLNEHRLYHYLRFTTDDNVIFYISPSQHHQALKLFDSLVPQRLYNITFGIDSDFDYWINIAKH